MIIISVSSVLEVDGEDTMNRIGKELSLEFSWDNFINILHSIEEFIRSAVQTSYNFLERN